MELAPARNQDRSPDRERSSDSADRDARAMGALTRFCHALAEDAPEALRGPVIAAGRRLESLHGVGGERGRRETDGVAFAVARQVARARQTGVEAGELTSEARVRAARSMADHLADGRGGPDDLRAMATTALTVGIDLRDVGAVAPADRPTQIARLAVVAGHVLGEMTDAKLDALPADVKVTVSDWALRHGVRPTVYGAALDRDAAGRGDPDLHIRRLAAETARDVASAPRMADAFRLAEAEPPSPERARAHEIGRAGNLYASLAAAHGGDRAETFLTLVKEQAGPKVAEDIRRSAPVDLRTQAGIAPSPEADRRGVVEEVVARRCAANAGRWDGRADKPIHGLRDPRNLEQYAKALEAADLLERSQDALETVERKTKSIADRLASRERRLAEAVARAEQGDPSVAKATEALDRARTRAEAFNGGVERTAQRLPEALRGGFRAVASGVGRLAGGDPARAEAGLEKARAGLAAKNPEIAELARGVAMLDSRLHASYKREASLKVEIDRHTTAADRAWAYGLSAPEFDAQVARAAADLKRLSAELAPIRDDVEGLAQAVAEGRPRTEILDRTVKLEERCRTEFGLPLSAAVQALTNREKAIAAADTERERMAG